MRQSWFKQLHWRILAGLFLGLIYGVIAARAGWQLFTGDWIAPFGIIFINLLKLIAVPLVFSSLVCGVVSLADLKKLSRIGGKTILVYLVTTAIAVMIGLIFVYLIRPGKQLPEQMRVDLQQVYQERAESRSREAESTRRRGPLQPLVDVIPENVVASASENRNLLQIVFVALLTGIGMLQISREKMEPLVRVFEAVNTLTVRLVDVIMLLAPLGAFSLIAATMTTLAADSPGGILHLLAGLGMYCVAVVAGLAVHMLCIYTLLLKCLTPLSLKNFYRAIAPAQLLAFSTSSSAATLPVTMERCEEKLGVSEEVSAFVLPLGATINMDGTALYQAVAAVFISDALGLNLGFGAQLTIVLTAVLASIGTAAVPSAGIVTLVIILEAIGVPVAGVALVLGLDRLLDMCRTTTNVTGDAVVAAVIAASEGELGLPDLSEAEDHIALEQR